MKRDRTQKVTQADLDRAATLMRTLGAKLAEIDVTPGRVRLITTEGRDLTLPDDRDELDRELEEHLHAHGHGRA
jgi:hypothetical protein